MRKPKTQFYIPIDLAAVCSVAFLLLLLYLSMAREKSEEPVEVNMPETSGYMCTLNTLGDAIILIGKDKVFLKLPDTVRKDALLEMSSKYNLRFTKSHLDRFKNIDFIGMPVAEFNQSKIAGNLAGISIQNPDNQLAAWIRAANKAYYSLYKRRMIIGIKADRDTGYPLIKNVIATLQDQDINKFAFITATKAKLND
nr:biopolymer transporter ExbD [Mucilaginibacter sp. L294]